MFKINTTKNLASKQPIKFAGSFFFPKWKAKITLSPFRVQTYSDDLATRAKAASVQYHHGYREGSYWPQHRSLRRADQQCVQRRRSPILKVVIGIIWSREAPKMKEDGHDEQRLLFYINLQFWFRYRFSDCNPCKPHPHSSLRQTVNDHMSVFSNMDYITMVSWFSAILVLEGLSLYHHNLLAAIIGSILHY